VYLIRSRKVPDFIPTCIDKMDDAKKERETKEQPTHKQTLGTFNEKFSRILNLRPLAALRNLLRRI
jgi:hypothetical protein